MGKNDLIAKIAHRTGMAKEPCEAVVDAMTEEITEALVKGEKIMLKGFMSFEVGERGERDARNPATGEIEHFPPVKTVKCKVAKTIKDAVNAK